MIISSKNIVKVSLGKGRGVFATENLKKGEVIEVAPIIILQHEELIDTKWNTLFDYYFWLDDFVVLALGFGSMYNHSEEPSAKYKINQKQKTITFTAIKDIKKDEEIFFNYRGSSTSKTPLWFEREKLRK